MGAKLGAAAAVVALADWLWWQKQQFGSSWGALALALLVAAVAVRPALWRNRTAWLAAALALFYAAALTDRPGPLALLLFGIGLGVTVLLPGVARFGDGWQWLQRLGWHGIRLPVAVLRDLVHLNKLRRRAKRGGRVQAAQLLARIAVPVTGSLIFLLLFAAANPVLEGWLERLRLPEFDGMMIMRFFFWAAIFQLVWLHLRPRLPKRVAGTFEGRGDLAIAGFSPAALKLSLIAFNAVFALQNLMDIAYLGGLAPLPQGMTLAEYAHRGAYPLIATASLAGLFTLVALRPGSTSARDPQTRGLLMVWIAQNLLLVFMSGERTIDYIKVYSLTEWRIAALMWMALVACGLVLIAVRMLRDKSASWLINTNLVAALAVLTPFTLVDISALAAQWNVRHAREAGGKGAALDLCYLNSMGAPALLPLVELEKQPGLVPAFRDRVSVVRRQVQSGVIVDQQYHYWTARNARRLAAAEKQAGRIAAEGWWEKHDCDGSRPAPAGATEPQGGLPLQAPPPVPAASQAPGAAATPDPAAQLRPPAPADTPR